jgi:BirA family biotin operon repressor/biotin-[acetyl-CoA-carboxylase] ligase
MPGTLGNAADLLPSAPLRRLVGRIVIVPQVASTNDLALDERALNDDGCVYLTELQTAGRGRLGMGWHAPRGASVLCSVRLVEAGRAPRCARMSLAAGIAVHEAILRATDVRPVLKWPNDLLVRQRKLAGVLIETRMLDSARHAVAVGVGINCLQHEGHFPAELRQCATSLELESGAAIDRRHVVRHLLAALDEWLAAERLADGEALRHEWLSRGLALGMHVELTHEGRTYRGTILDLDADAGLLVSLEDGGRRWFGPLRTHVVAQKKV